MNAIPKGHRPDEFSLRINYRSMGTGYGKADIPGFYLHAGFANEGVATALIEDLLLDPATFRNILTEINCNPLVHDALGGGTSEQGGWVLSEAGKAIAEEGVSTIRARIATIETQQQRDAEQLRVLKNALARST